MKFSYVPRGVCPMRISFEIEGDVLKDLEFEGGCNGNLKALSILLKGQPVSYIKEKLEGIRCGSKSTSCSDQLVKGIDAALEKMAEN
ncbi:MAG: TIGR03905 family TSCPD domain-containing protein [Clostridiales bacterium]|nr:TIGR03905 family TSCPD domain-containing protein [Clostridiales bacterium]